MVYGNLLCYSISFCRCVCVNSIISVFSEIFIVSELFDIVLPLHPSISNIIVFQSFEVGRYLYW